MLLPSIEFGSPFTYCPRPKSNQEAAESKTFTYHLKQDAIHPSASIPMSDYVAQKVRAQLRNMPFASFLGPDVYLVPAPRSSPLKEGMLWVPRNIVEAFSKEGLGRAFICLERREPVPKSASSLQGKRPKASDHYRTLQIKPGLERIEKPRKIVIVDDVITTGATLLGAATRLSEVFGDATIRALAIVRTISNEVSFSKIEDPCIGTVKLLPDGRTQRDP